MKFIKILYNGAGFLVCTCVVGALDAMLWVADKIPSK